MTNKTLQPRKIKAVLLGLLVHILELVTEDALRKLIDESWNLVKPKVKKRG